jgi:hypothetical protein
MLIDQFNALTLKEQSETIKAIRLAYAENRANAKAAKADARLQKQQAKALKQEQAIVRAQLRLEKLLAKQVGPVGTKARKAAKRPGPVTVTYGAEANAIAANIKARKEAANAVA